MAFNRCPGSSTTRQPVPEIVPCPKCATETEIWSDEATAKCRGCGADVYRQSAQSCLDWCRYAAQCVGEEKFKQYGEMKTTLRKQGLLNAVISRFGEGAGPVTRAREAVDAAERLLAEEQAADPNLVIAAAAVHVCGTDAAGMAEIRELLKSLDYPRDFTDSVCALLAPDAAAQSLDGRLVADALALTRSRHTGGSEVYATATAEKMAACRKKPGLT